MTRPITWSDEELREAANDPRSGVWQCGTWDGLRGFLTALGALHPAEAREREREAWYKGFVHSLNGGDKIIGLNHQYPSLLPKSPPPLVLSTGTWRRSEAGCYRGKWDCGGAMVYSTPTLGTASDARKLAAWLSEYGSEEERK